MTPNLLDELEKIIALRDAAEYENVYGSAESFAEADKAYKAGAASFIATHAPTLADMAKRLEAAERDARRWRFFCDEYTHGYGDGYTEPEECHAELQWQQGPWIRDGSNGGAGRKDTFPGWNAIIDEAMEKQRLELADLDEDAAIDATQEGEG